MGVSVTCTTAAKQADGRIILGWSDGTQTEYASLADAHLATYELDTSPALAKKWFVANWLKNDPAAASPGLYANGKTCTLDVGAGQPVSVV